MHWFTAGIFLTGELAGGGMIALPLAARNQGFYFGLASTIILMFMCAYTSIILGRTWVILMRHWPMYHHHTKNPYAEIGRRALGHNMRRAVGIILNNGMFGVGALFLVVVSKGVNDMLKTFWAIEFDYCYMVLIVASIILPSFYLRSPENLTWIINAGSLCTIMAIVFAMIGIIKDAWLCDLGVKPVDYSVLRVAGGFGTMFFAYGGHAVFPIIQHDMKKPYLFTRSSNMAYTLVGFMYIPIVVAGNLVYGNNVQPSIINNINTPWIQQTVNILFFMHCALTVVLVMNPMNQQVEHFGGAPAEFSLRRVLCRTGVMLAAVFVAETFPRFGPLIDLIGGTAFTATSFIFPVVFYLFVNAKDKKMREMEEEGEEVELDENEEKTVSMGLWEACGYISKLDMAVCLSIVVVAVLVCFSATASALEELSYSQFITQCYLKYIWPWPASESTNTSIACCGDYKNISPYEGQCYRSLI
ncbi:unnamed protein product [Bursaphelenchus okinawaensis]|uniref:Amino acid transporter transmembrane domain-containing protein n=1 Tax=Bursaphelenchus okinawaensis TaxID=465554 RepID=A0A811JRL7_9BILA|nr:unnamed protein product [Bursaphelenchus okinawaensis]CAG9079857.1 unnamed protein product [Bursaphelenchus okinawaensis]